MSRSYATTWIKLKIQGDPGQLAVAFWDAHQQNGDAVFVGKKGKFDAANGVWYVPMETGASLRLDLVRGIALGEIGNTAAAFAQVQLPIRLLSTGRLDNRPLGVQPMGSEVTVTVDPSRVVKDLANYGFGCHWDYSEGMPDAIDAKAPISFYRDMGFNMVRSGTPLVPAGDRRADLDEIPKRGWPKLQPLPFTDLVSLFEKARMSKIAITLPFNEYFMLPPATRPSLADWSENVPSWVLYLRRQDAFDGRYYELGNEVWSKDNKMGGAATGVNGDYIGPAIPGAVRLFSSRVKEADPDAKFMASYSGFDTSWAYLMQVLPSLDVINFSFYGWEEGYEKFRNGSTLGIGEAEKRLKNLDPVAAKRIMFGATEYAPNDWAPEFEGQGWVNANDLGHSLWGFSQAAESLANPKMAFACQWTVRWVWEHENRMTGEKVWKPDDIYPSEDWDLLTSERKVTALAKALRLLGRNRLDEVVKSETSECPQVLSVATRSRDGKMLNVFILNKDYGAKNISLRLGNTGAKSLNARVFTGNGLNDPEPTIRVLPVKGALGDGKVRLKAPELSITLLTFKS